MSEWQDFILAMAIMLAGYSYTVYRMKRQGCFNEDPRGLLALTVIGWPIFLGLSLLEPLDDK